MSMTSLFLGVIGGSAGLAIFFHYLTSPFSTSVGFSGLDIGIGLMNFAVLFAGPGAILGILGGILSTYRRTAAGILLLGGFATVSAGWIYVLAEAVAEELHVAFFLFLITISFVWWSGLILMGALFAFPKTQEILRKSWEPWPGAKPMGKTLDNDLS